MSSSLLDTEGTWALYSRVATNFGGDAKNFIFEGLLDDCQQKLEQMKALDEHSRLCKELQNKLDEGLDG